jgi:hypothetical protein
MAFSLSNCSVASKFFRTFDLTVDLKSHTPVTAQYYTTKDLADQALNPMVDVYQPVQGFDQFPATLTRRRVRVRLVRW